MNANSKIVRWQHIWLPMWIYSLITYAAQQRRPVPLGPAPGLKGRDRNRRCDCGLIAGTHKLKHHTA